VEYADLITVADSLRARNVRAAMQAVSLGACSEQKLATSVSSRSSLHRRRLLSQDGVMRGIVALGAVTPDEFLAAFARWPTALRPITPSILRDEVYAIVQPSQVASPALPRGRYQSLKFTIAARRKAARAISSPIEKVISRYVEPMPILI
jgi:hypothetical protein